MSASAGSGDAREDSRGRQPGADPPRDGLEKLARSLSPVRGPALLVTRNNLSLAERLRRESPGLQWTVRTKNDLRGVSARGLLRLLRSRRWRALVVEDRVQEAHRRRDLYHVLLIAGKARLRWLVFTEGERIQAERVHRFRSLLGLTLALVAEAAATVRALWGARRFTRRVARLPRPPARVSPAADNRRVAVVRTDFWFDLKAGGSVSHALGVLGGMRKLGLEPRLWTSSRLPEGSLPFEQIEVRPGRRPALLEEAAMAAYNRTFLDRVEGDLQSFRPAVIYQRHSLFSLAGAALARRLGVPLVLEVNASEVWARQAWSRLAFCGLARDMERAALETADRLVLISRELVPVIRELGGDESRMVVNPNGVEVERFDPSDNGSEVRRAMGIEPDAIVCAFLGTFTRWHGVLFLAEQISELVRADPRLVFLFLGDGDLRPEVEHRLREAGAMERARFAGLVRPEAVPRTLAACDILLSPHLPFEDGTPFFGSPTKLFEYMAAGRAIVASRLGQIGRVVEDGKSGLLYSPGDADAFRKAVLRLAGDRQMRRAMGAEARKAAETRYTWRANARRALEGLIELSGPSASA